jgi:cytochrome c553
MIAIRTHRPGTFALLVAMWLPVATPVVASDFIDLRGIRALQGDAGAGKMKATVCMACHGPAGISPVPMFPNLAGQHAEYLYWQLVQFKREGRPESPMTAQVANLDDIAMRDLAAYFASLPAVTATPRAELDSADQAGRLYREGDPTAGVPPCQGCHGIDGEGHPRASEDAHWRAYPVLRGQHATYVVQRLKALRDGKHALSSSDRVMTPIARTLDDAAIEALASWLETPTH